MDCQPTSGTAVVVLAAGGSTRLGSAKQSLVYQGKTLLRRAAEAARAVAGDRPVAVVLGAEAARLRSELAGLEVVVAENPSWATGMGGSLRRGMEALDLTRVEGMLLTLCDQPFVGADELARVIRGNAGEGSIVASAYGGTVGVPAWFGRAFFEELRALPDGEGAKALLRRHAGRVVHVELPEAEVDVDTREQYERLVGEGGGFGRVVAPGGR